MDKFYLKEFACIGKNKQQIMPEVEKLLKHTNFDQYEKENRI